MDIKTISKPSWVVIFPAVTPKLGDRNISFLLSAQQVEEIVDVMEVWSIPFAPSYVEGIADWRNDVLPVLSIEKCLGFEVSDYGYGAHLLVVRSSNSNISDPKSIRGLVRIGSGIRNVALPIESSPVNFNGWIPNHRLVRGIYEWQDGYLVVADLTKILNGLVKSGDLMNISSKE